MTAAVQGLLAGLSLIVAIGAQNAFVLRQGIRREHVAIVVVVCALADAVLITVGIAGLGAAITTHPTALAVARYGGAVFLLGFAVAALARARRPGRLVPSDARPATRSGVLLAALGFTFLNPHVYLDTVVLLGSLAAQHGDPGRWLFGAGAVAASATWFTALGWGARRLQPFFARPRSWQLLDYAVAGIVTVLAVGLLV